MSKLENEKQLLVELNHLKLMNYDYNKNLPILIKKLKQGNNESKKYIKTPLVM